MNRRIGIVALLLCSCASGSMDPGDSIPVQTDSGQMDAGNETGMTDAGVSDVVQDASPVSAHRGNFYGDWQPIDGGYQYWSCGDGTWECFQDSMHSMSTTGAPSNNCVFALEPGVPVFNCTDAPCVVYSFLGLPDGSVLSYLWECPDEIHYPSSECTHLTGSMFECPNGYR